MLSIVSFYWKLYCRCLIDLIIYLCYRCLLILLVKMIYKYVERFIYVSFLKGWNLFFYYW